MILDFLLFIVNLTSDQKKYYNMHLMCFFLMLYIIIFYYKYFGACANYTKMFGENQ